MNRVVIITGTNTGVGKTVATAALALHSGPSTIVVKPVQTGITGTEPTDVDEIERLSGRAVVQFTALDDPLAPDTAARLRGVSIPPVADYVERIRLLNTEHETVIVEGAGGVLVRLDTDGGTLLDLAAELAESAAVEVVVVASAGLGTLNHTELTVGALRARGLEPTGLIIGAWPLNPGLAEQRNSHDLPRVTGVPLIATIPTGVGDFDRATFADRSPTWFSQTQNRGPF
jgi:dethiobiotin synthase